MSKKVILAGHCGADSTFLRMAVQKADRTAKVVVASGEADLHAELNAGPALVLVNRILEYGYPQEEGVALVAALRQSHPQAQSIMVSNYEEAQQAAEAAGALPGFGKREIGSPKVTQLLQEAMEAIAAASNPPAKA